MGETEEGPGRGLPRGLQHTPELEAAADRVLADGTSEVVVGGGRRMVFVSDTLLERTKEKFGAEKVEAEMAKAWKIKRDDGRMVYVWGAPSGDGVFGLGKPKLG